MEKQNALCENAPDFIIVNNTLKINWLKQLLHRTLYIFSTNGSLDYVLCDYETETLLVPLSNFHKQMFLVWSFIYKHQFSPDRCFIWNNQHFKYKNIVYFYFLTCGNS